MLLFFCLANLTLEYTSYKVQYENKHATYSSNSSRKDNLLISPNSFLITESNWGFLPLVVLGGWFAARILADWHFGRFCRCFPLLAPALFQGGLLPGIQDIKINSNVTTWCTSSNWALEVADVQNLRSIGESTIQWLILRRHSRKYREPAVLWCSRCMFLQTAPFLSEFTFVPRTQQHKIIVAEGARNNERYQCYIVASSSEPLA